MTETTDHHWPPGFMAARAGFCARLPEEAWAKWAAQFGAAWPADPAARLAFIDSYLEKEMRTRDVTPEHLRERLRYPRIRKDINGYRGWLLNVVFRQLCAPESEKAYIFPEDLPKVLEDIALFRKHCREIEDPKRRGLTAQNYPTGESLQEVAIPWRPKFPLTSEDWAAAHKKFLLEEGGNGEALLLKRFDDGTEILVPLTFEASKAYGSPRWCTMYSKDYYNKYSQQAPLFIVIEPDGSRWQAHFPKKQFADAEDKMVGLDGFPPQAARYLKGIEEGPEVAGALLDHWDRLEERGLSYDLQQGLYVAVMGQPVWPEEHIGVHVKKVERQALSILHLLKVAFKKKNKSLSEYLLCHSPRAEVLINSQFLASPLLYLAAEQGFDYGVDLFLNSPFLNPEMLLIAIRKAVHCSTTPDASLARLLERAPLTSRELNEVGSPFVEGPWTIFRIVLSKKDRPLSLAILLRNPLLKAETVNFEPGDGGAQLVAAARRENWGNVDVLLGCKQLTAEGLNARDESGASALDYIVYHDQETLFTKMLDDPRLSADVLNNGSPRGQRPLTVAAEYFSANHIRRFLQDDRLCCDSILAINEERGLNAIEMLNLRGHSSLADEMEERLAVLQAREAKKAAARPLPLLRSGGPSAGCAAS